MTTAAAEAFDPELLRILRAAPWRTIERRFLFILAASIGLHLAFASYLAAQPAPIELSSDDFDRGFNPAVQPLPPLHPIPKLPNLPTQAAPSRPVLAAPAAPRPAVDRARVAKLGILGVLNADSPGSAFAGLLAPGSTEIAQALEGAHGVLPIASDGPAIPKGAHAGATATIERMGTEGVKKVALGARVDSHPAPLTEGPMVLEHPTELDPRLLQQFITARRAALQGCYERALLHNPSLQGGRMVLRLSIGGGGRVSDLEIDDDSLGSEAVSSCVSTLVKRWVFPVAPKEALPVSVPLIFARSN